MYHIKTEVTFDSAHFLHEYDGKCRNIHGHHWRVCARISAESLVAQGEKKGMVVDFSTFKRDLKEEADYLDHSLMFERGSLKEATVLALEGEGFKLLPLEFRPTAENLAKYFWDKLKERGYGVTYIEVYETPKNCAAYSEDCL
jgi:6-pyruvoyltetrahydropterin/6-carboxytetrahydropterin synthase